MKDIDTFQFRSSAVQSVAEASGGASDGTVWDGFLFG